jgi:BirA family biotin operon repressor/biotin-[acetyl-CoA-carboxylase] ligase
VVIAGSQTAGRGRLGRLWHSPPGAGLYLSVLLRPEEPLALCGRYTLAAAVAACGASREFGGATVHIRWPNDLLSEGKKLGGVLAEIRTGPAGPELVLGIGMNLNHDAADFPSALAAIATSLKVMRRGVAVDHVEFAARLLARLGDEIGDLRTARWDRVADRFLGYAPHAHGTRVRLATGDAGTTCGLDDTGALRVATARGEVLVHGSESVTVVEE